MAEETADYVVVEDSSPQNLSRRVREMVQRNYVPQGGLVIVALGNDDYLYAQAMVFNLS